MKNCDTCVNFIKIKSWKDGRKGLCEYLDASIDNLKGKDCEYYLSKRYSRKKK